MNVDQETVELTSKWNGGVGNGDEESDIDEATREAIRLERKVRRRD